VEIEYGKLRVKLKESEDELGKKLELIKDLEDRNFKLTQEVEGHIVIQEDFENRINELYKTIDQTNEIVLKYEKDNEHKSYKITELKERIDLQQKEKDVVDSKLEMVENDRLKLKDNLQELKVFEYDLYNKVVDKDTEIDRANLEIDKLKKKTQQQEKNQVKMIRKLENSEKNMIQMEKQQREQVNSLNAIIQRQEEDVKHLHSRVEVKQKELLEIKQENNELEMKNDTLSHEVHELKSELELIRKTDKIQKEEINELSSKLKTTKTKKQHLERTIQQLKEFKDTVEETTQKKITKLTEALQKEKNFNSREQDIIFMMYEDLRSQCYEFKFTNDELREKNQQMSELILGLTRERNNLLEKISMLEKSLEKTRIDLENMKSENFHLDIKLKDHNEMIIYLKKNLELKSMSLEEYYQRYVKLYTENHHLQSKHTVLSHRFAQYELIVKTSKSMLEALRNRKNAKVQTEMFRQHDIAIMTDLVWKDIAQSGIRPSVSSNKSELSLYPSYKKKHLDDKADLFKPRMSFNKELSEDSDKMIKLGDSDERFKFPLSSQKTVSIFRESKIKFSFMESQMSSIRKIPSRYDSK
jgi:chromosome segregation ATPase